MYIFTVDGVKWACDGVYYVSHVVNGSSVCCYGFVVLMMLLFVLRLDRAFLCLSSVDGRALQMVNVCCHAGRARGRVHTLSERDINKY